jgi:hypothetical protein
MDIHDIVFDDELKEKIQLIMLDRTVVDPKTNCWNWPGSKDACGYGRLRVKDTMMYTHRLSAVVFNNETLHDKYVLHKCDNPNCCNPAHIFTGTQRENMRDSKYKGRLRNGLGNNKLIEGDIIKIKALYKLGFTISKLAQIYDLNPNTINSIVNNSNEKCAI